MSVNTAPHSDRLFKRAYWLIRLRWVMIVGTCLGAWATYRWLDIIQWDIPCYAIAGVLSLENVISLYLLNYVIRKKSKYTFLSIRRIIHLQICADLVLLATLLHYTGGIENPLVVCFIFHIVIAGILLSVRESYLQATFAVFLIVFLALLEYRSIIPHHPLTGVLPHGFYAEGLYVFGTVSVLAATFYLIVYLTSDISTQLRQQEQAYRQANEQLQNKDQIRDEYVFRITHDVKGHLAAIQSCHDVMTSTIVGPLNAKQEEFVQRASLRTSKLSQFVEKLLRLTEMRLSNHLDRDSFPMDPLLQSALATVRIHAENKNITMSSHIEANLGSAYGNRLSIEEAVTNLLLNAIKYSRKGDTVTLRADQQQDAIAVEISDTGIGIPKSELCKVFEEFFRATNARKIERNGTGLGLAIAKQIIERHQGKIWAESEEGSGTSFHFHIPTPRHSPL
ncbi:sensor histidine kinase [Planctomycetota bacterium]